MQTVDSEEEFRVALIKELEDRAREKDLIAKEASAEAVKIRSAIAVINQAFASREKAQ